MDTEFEIEPFVSWSLRANCSKQLVLYTCLHRCFHRPFWWRPSLWWCPFPQKLRNLGLLILGLDIGVVAEDQQSHFRKCQPWVELADDQPRSCLIVVDVWSKVCTSWFLEWEPWFWCRGWWYSRRQCAGSVIQTLRCLPVSLNKLHQRNQV